MDSGFYARSHGNTHSARPINGGEQRCKEAPLRPLHRRPEAERDYLRLATSTASVQMAELWSSEYKVVLERRLWLAVLRAQQELGIDVGTDVM